MDSKKCNDVRLPLQVDVELHREGYPVQVVQTGNLSGTGALIIMGKPNDWPEVGERVKLRVIGTLGGEDPAPLVDASIVRHLCEGVALVFIEDERAFLFE